MAQAGWSNHSNDATIPLMSRFRTLIILTAFTVAFLSGGVYAYWFFLIRGPLAGETSHDFGEVPLYEDTAKVDYTFHLTNRLSHPLTINAIRPECGCLTTQDVHETLAPGAAFDLPVTLIAKTGPRTVIIHVIFGDDNVQTLRVKATGRPQPRMITLASALALGDDGQVQTAVSVLTYNQFDAPPTPRATTSDENLTANFAGWSLRYRPKDVALSPTQWMGTLTVRYKGDARQLPDGETVTLNMPAAKPLLLAIKPPGTVIEPTMSTDPGLGSPIDEPTPTSRPGGRKGRGE